MNDIDFQNSYLKQQLIAYIGNKRKLLPLIELAISKFYPNGVKGLKFADFFAGSGSVSRLAKMLNCRVLTNDWEHYSYIINKSFIGINKKDLDLLFAEEGGIENCLDYFNNLSFPKKSEEYIAKYYSCQNIDIDKADYHKERLFYTRLNGLAIDKIRNEIDIKYPKDSNNIATIKKRELLISLLVYEAATHTNTSGVFKAFHKGFGGHSGDALKRILQPITLKLPVLVDSDYENKIFSLDAKKFAQLDDLKNIDIAYLDPPYNQHQYGSNYHLLNTIAIWDKIDVPLEKNEKGELLHKGGIREDWVKTKSSFCYKHSATDDFEKLLLSIDAKTILISYSTDGIIPFERMLNICAKKGKIGIVTNEYTKFRGGRQSNSCEVKNIEYIITIDCQKTSVSADFTNIYKIIHTNKVNLLLTKIFSIKKLYENFEVDENSISTQIINKKIIIERSELVKLKKVVDIDKLTLPMLIVLEKKLHNSLCATKEEEIEELIKFIELDTTAAKSYAKKLPAYLKKLVHKKYISIYYRLLEKIKSLQIENDSLHLSINNQLKEVEQLAYKRFAG